MNTTGTQVWQFDCAVPKQHYEKFEFSIEVTYYVRSFLLMIDRKKAKASFLDSSKSQYIFIGFATDGKPIEKEAVCDMYVDMIKNIASFNLRSALLQMKAMINQQEVHVKYEGKDSKHSHGVAFDMDKTIQICRPQILVKDVIKRIDISSKTLMAFCYFLFVIKADKKDLPPIFENHTAELIVEACKCATKREIPHDFIEPIITIVEKICRIVFRDMLSALLVIDVVNDLANTDFLSKLIDDCEDIEERFPLYKPTERFDWKDLLLKMYKSNIELLQKVVKKLGRTMLLELLIFLFENGIMKNNVIQDFENHLDCLNCKDIKIFGLKNELPKVLSLWESIAKCHIQRSKKFIYETENAIISSVSTIVENQEFELILKVIADDNLFEGASLQNKLVEVLSRSKTAETPNSIKQLIKLLNHEKLKASGIEIYNSITVWFRNGLLIKHLSEKNKCNYKIIDEAYSWLSEVLQTNYVMKHDKVKCSLKNELFQVIVQFKSEAIAKVLHEVDKLSDVVRDIFVGHVRQMLKEDYFGDDVNTFLFDICENDVLNVENR